jgi:hypothetical protein
MFYEEKRNPSELVSGIQNNHSFSFAIFVVVSLDMLVSEHGVFSHALQSLSLERHETKTCTDDNNQMVGSVCINI